MPNDRQQTFYTIREVALILSVEPSRVSHAVRVGSLRAVMRRGRLMIPADSLMQALDGPTDHESTTGDDQQFGGGQ